MLVSRNARPELELDYGLSIGVISRCLARNRIVLLVITITFGVLGAIAAWVQQPVYRATVVFALVPPPFASRLGPLGGSLSSLSGLASRVGGLDTTQSASDFTVNLEVLKSRDLARAFLDENRLTERMARASHPWWIPGHSSMPYKLEDGVRYFRDDVLTITPMEATGVFRLDIEWPNAREAATWANSLIEFANSQLSTSAAARSERRLQFLRERLRAEPIVQVQEVLSGLIAEEMKNLAVTTNADAYAFRLIDRAFVPSEKAKPHRLLIVLLAALTGLILSSLFILTRESARGTLYA